MLGGETILGMKHRRDRHAPACLPVYDDVAGASQRDVPESRDVPEPNFALM